MSFAVLSGGDKAILGADTMNFQRGKLWFRSCPGQRLLALASFPATPAAMAIYEFFANIDGSWRAEDLQRPVESKSTTAARVR